jgi:hypothetical protein
MGGVSHAIRKGGCLPVQDGLRKLSPHRPLWPMPGLARPALSRVAHPRPIRGRPPGGLRHRATSSLVTGFSTIGRLINADATPKNTDSHQTTS